MEANEQSQHLTSRRSFLLKGARGWSSQPRRGRPVARAVGGARKRWPDKGRRGDSPVPRRGRDHRDRSLAAVQRARRHPGQRSPRRHRQPGLRRGCRGAGRGHGPVHPRQHRRRDLARRLHQRLPEGARQADGQPRQVPHAAEQPGDRRAADRTSDEPDAADRRHQLLDALPQRLAEPRLRRQAPAGRPGPGRRASSRRFPAATTTSARPTTCRRSPTRPASTSASSSRAAPASTPSSPSGSPIPRCCGSCSASGRPRRCTSRPGRQGRQRAAAHRPDERSGLPRPERRR